MDRRAIPWNCDARTVLVITSIIRPGTGGEEGRLKVAEMLTQPVNELLDSCERCTYSSLFSYPILTNLRQSNKICNLFFQY